VTSDWERIRRGSERIVCRHDSDCNLQLANSRCHSFTSFSAIVVVFRDSLALLFYIVIVSRSQPWISVVLVRRSFTSFPALVICR
jgi:hypothetical protein